MLREQRFHELRDEIDPRLDRQYEPDLQRSRQTQKGRLGRRRPLRPQGVREASSRVVDLQAQQVPESVQGTEEIIRNVLQRLARR